VVSCLVRPWFGLVSVVTGGLVVVSVSVLGGLANAGEVMDGVATSTSASAATIAIVAVSVFPFVNIASPHIL
jgi:hypothetical protein